MIIVADGYDSYMYGYDYWSYDCVVLKTPDSRCSPVLLSLASLEQLGSLVRESYASPLSKSTSVVPVGQYVSCTITVW